MIDEHREKKSQTITIIKYMNNKNNSKLELETIVVVQELFVNCWYLKPKNNICYIVIIILPNFSNFHKLNKLQQNY